MRSKTHKQLNNLTCARIHTKSWAGAWLSHTSSCLGSIQMPLVRNSRCRDTGHEFCLRTPQRILMCRQNENYHPDCNYNLNFHVLRNHLRTLFKWRFCFSCLVKIRDSAFLTSSKVRSMQLVRESYFMYQCSKLFLQNSNEASSVKIFITFSRRMKHSAPSSVAPYISDSLNKHSLVVPLLAWLPYYTRTPKYCEHLKGKDNDLLISIVTSFLSQVFEKCSKGRKSKRGRIWELSYLSQALLSNYHQVNLCS